MPAVNYGRTPRLVLDEERLEVNIRAAAARVAELGGVLRPHVKTHKSTEIMQRQIAAGATGITVATIREAEVMIEAGATDVLLAYPPVGRFRLDALRALAQRARVIVSCSEEAHVEMLASTGAPLEYYWEIECGTRRLGTPAGEATAAVLARVATRVPRVRLAGLMAFAGHAYGATSKDDLHKVVDAERDALLETAQTLVNRSIDPGVLSVGATPLMRWESGFASEYRFGNYVFNDATQVSLGAVAEEQCALTVEATVVGRPAADRLILDCGSKALASEKMGRLTSGFGIVRAHPELRIESLYEEHGICSIDEGGTALELNDRVDVIPNHACTCANLHDAYWVRNVDMPDRAWPLDARGW
jgi:D-serine deaminase-like pyridoxal phosphate-dependent protein